MNRYVLTAIIAAALVSCGRSGDKGDARDKIAVSIAPLATLVDSLTCGDFDITVLVPPGESPETFSPTPVRIRDVSDSRIYFGTGLMDFERELERRMQGAGNGPRMVNLSEGIELAGGDEGHGADPHIWLSPKALKVMLRTAADAVLEEYPDSAKYEAAYRRLEARADSLEHALGAELERSRRRSFVIYHPALTYYARDYALRQIPIETEGKEPTATGLKRAIREAAADSVRHVLYQREYPVETVETVAAEIGALPAQIDPLNPDLFGELSRITELIAAP